MKKFNWESDLSQNIVDWAWKEFYKESKIVDDPCIDNFRIALKSNKEQVDQFHEDEGCCGRHHWRAEGPDGLYVLGFNYGH